MAIPWLRPQDKRSLQGMDAQQEQFPANDSYYGERRELAAYGGSPQNEAMQTAQFTVPSNFNRMGPDAGLDSASSGAGPSQFAQDQMRRVEAARGQQPGASWNTASPVQPAQQQGGPSQFAQDQAQRFGADMAKSGGWGAPAATAQPMQQGNYAQAAPAVAQNRVSPMIENSRTAVMNNPAPAPAQAQATPQVQSSGATVQAYSGQQQRSAQNTASPAQADYAQAYSGQQQQKSLQGAAPQAQSYGAAAQASQRQWNRPGQRQPMWGRAKQQPMSQGNTASPAQPARRDAAAYGQPKKWGA